MRIAWFFREHKIVTGVILFDLLIIVVMIVMMVMKAGKTATVDIMTVPAVARVRIGGGEYENGTYKVHPGDYEATVSAEGFVAKTVPVEARAGEISKVWVYLVPEEGNLNYYAQHEEDWENMRLLDDEEAQRVWKVLSIQEELPMEYVKEGINNGDEAIMKYVVITGFAMDCDGYYCLKVATAFNKNEDTVRKMLIDKGFSIDNYEVWWKIYTGENSGGDALMEMREGEWGA